MCTSSVKSHRTIESILGDLDVASLLSPLGKLTQPLSKVIDQFTDLIKSEQEIYCFALNVNAIWWQWFCLRYPPMDSEPA